MQATSQSPFTVLWRVRLVSPSGQPEWLELRAPSERLALEAVTTWRPDWSVTAITRRPTAA